MDGRKRAHGTEHGDPFRDAKRSRPSGPSDEATKTEEIDLVDDEDMVLLEQQSKALREAQRTDDSSGPKSFSAMTCIICMDNYTDLTATPCGGYFSFLQNEPPS